MANRKFQLGDVVLWNNGLMGNRDVYAVVVDYTQDAAKRGEYRVQRVMHPLNGGAFGPAVWVAPHHLLSTKYGKRKRNMRIYKANRKLAERGCACNCCAHEAVPHKSIRKDGTFTWDPVEN